MATTDDRIRAFVAAYLESMAEVRGEDGEPLAGDDYTEMDERQTLWEGDAMALLLDIAATA